MNTYKVHVKLIPTHNTFSESPEIIENNWTNLKLYIHGEIAFYSFTTLVIIYETIKQSIPSLCQQSIFTFFRNQIHIVDGDLLLKVSRSY